MLCYCGYLVDLQYEQTRLRHQHTLMQGSAQSRADLEGANTYMVQLEQEPRPAGDVP